MPLQTSSNTSFDLFLIGDTGDIALSKPDPVLEMLNAHFDPNQASSVIFLGDNIYPRGLPPVGNILRKNAENTLIRHHEALKNYPGKVVFIAGNHDWNKGRKNGKEYIERQGQYLEGLFGEKVLLPEGGCPGPASFTLNDNIAVVAIDTQWWMQKALSFNGLACADGLTSEEDFFDRLVQLLDANRRKHLLVIGHHPVYSYAIHGGRFKLKHHIFPLTLFDQDAWIPLPGIGSLLPLYRRFLGAREDMAHPPYRRLRHKLKEILSNYSNLIYAAGHEHNLQYIRKNRNHFIVSGSGSKVKYVVQSGKYLQFGEKSKGFFKLHFAIDGTVYLSAWALDTSGNLSKGKLIYEEQII
ncbi:Surface antigen (D15) precursor [Arcticibacter svalbardensis MN12-7]|uniref:Surface antigen (D15) n=1 Tax=Arcticibacter svalbardensis MN12-7 TaxID=1150600 RepID=R9GW20_9SPHI|nr:metallophosphoesterase [Arcticibacter svalbardensis]EOR95705.1 Surface antigen (D15) precursor [Arcticibacter svalbardensis MN12-7]